MRLERLPRAITGFFNRGEPGRWIDQMAFKRACYAVAQMDGGAVRLFCSETIARNYYSARLDTRAESVVALCNNVYPYLAFVSVDDDNSGFRDQNFIPTVNIAALFEAATEFSVLDAEWLMSRLNNDLLLDLNNVDLRRIKSYKSNRVGEVIFNHWD